MRTGFIAALSIFAVLNNGSASAYDWTDFFSTFENNNQRKTETLESFVSRIMNLNLEKLGEAQKKQVEPVKNFFSAQQKTLKFLDDVKKNAEASIQGASESVLAVRLNNITHAISEFPTLQKTQSEAVKTLFENDSERIKNIRKSYHEIIQAFLKGKDSSDTVDKAKRRAMAVAIKNEYVDVVKMILNSDVSLDVPNDKGITLLMIAAKNSEKIMPLLIRAGANINACDKAGYYVIDYAYKGQKTENVKQLKNLKAKEKARHHKQYK